MVTLLLALALSPLGQSDTAPVGRMEAGAVGWHEGTRCHNCHGDEGEGAFAPDLAGGRGLTWQQFRRAVRKPWGESRAPARGKAPGDGVSRSAIA